MTCCIWQQIRCGSEGEEWGRGGIQSSWSAGQLPTRCLGGAGPVHGTPADSSVAPGRVSGENHSALQVNTDSLGARHLRDAPTIVAINLREVASEAGSQGTLGVEIGGGMPGKIWRLPLALGYGGRPDCPPAVAIKISVPIMVSDCSLQVMLSPANWATGLVDIRPAWMATWYSSVYLYDGGYCHLQLSWELTLV